MHPRQASPSGFKRQVVFRISPEDWPLLEQAAAEHGSIQAAILAGLHALQPEPAEQAENAMAAPPTPQAATAADDAAGSTADRETEITAREAAQMLELTVGTVRGYIRSGRLPGRYDAEPQWRGWLTNRGAVADYQREVQGKR